MGTHVNEYRFDESIESSEHRCPPGLALTRNQINTVALGHMNRLTEPGPESFQEKLDDLRTFALDRLSNIRDSLERTGQFERPVRFWLNSLAGSR